MINDLKTIGYWVQRGLRRNVLDITPPQGDITAASRALLDFRNMTGGGNVDLPSGIWFVDQPLTLGDNIHLNGNDSVMTGPADVFIKGAGDNIFISNMNFLLTKKSVCLSHNLQHLQ